jgi:lysophospholipase L1-like esterase
VFRTLFWALLPVTIPQGLWLRRRATRLPGAAGERRGACGQGADLHLLAIGDSIIDGVGTGTVEASLPGRLAAALAGRGYRVHWRIEGTSGHGLREVAARLASLPAGIHADLVLMSVGVNDVTRLTRTHRWRLGLRELLRMIGRRWPNARILFAGLPPMERFPLPPQPLRFSLGLRARTLDGIASDLIRDAPNAVHVPTRIDPQVHGFCADGFHPSAESCTLWAYELAGMLMAGGAGHPPGVQAGTPAMTETRSTAP